MTILASDSFNRANGALGGNWTASPGLSAFTVSSNEAIPTSASNSGARYIGGTVGPSTFPDVQYSEVILGASIDAVTDSGVGACTRISSVGETFYLTQSNTHETRLYKVITGTFTQLGTDGPAGASGDVVRLTSDGTTHTVTQNGTTIIGPITDSSITSGQPGIWGAAGSPLGTINSWSAGVPNVPFELKLIGTASASSGTPLTTSSSTTSATGSTFLVGCIYWPTSTGGASPSGVPTDTFGNIYVAQGAAAQIASADMAIQWWVKENGAGGASHAATLAFANAGGTAAIIFAEITSTSTYATVDLTTSNAALTNPGPFSVSSGALGSTNSLIVTLASVDTGSFNGSTVINSSNQAVVSTAQPTTLWDYGFGYMAQTGSTSAVSPDWTFDSGGLNHTAAETLIAFKVFTGGLAPPMARSIASRIAPLLRY